MRHFWFKLVLFLCLWYEVAAELRLDGDRALLVTLAIIGLGWFLLRMSGSLIGMLGPTMHRLLVGTVIWLLLFWWFAPNALKALPVAVLLAMALGVAALGARCRHWFELNHHRIDKAYLRNHSEVVLLTVFGTLGLIAFSLEYWGSLWPLIGCVMLPGLPFGFGWQLASQLAHKRADAKFGDKASFRDAGISEER
jgi:hypothetical protein